MSNVFLRWENTEQLKVVFNVSMGRVQVIQRAGSFLPCGSQHFIDPFLLPEVVTKMHF